MLVYCDIRDDFDRACVVREFEAKKKPALLRAVRRIYVFFATSIQSLTMK